MITHGFLGIQLILHSIYDCDIIGLVFQTCMHDYLNMLSVLTSYNSYFPSCYCMEPHPIMCVCVGGLIFRYWIEISYIRLSAWY